MLRIARNDILIVDPRIKVGGGALTVSVAGIRIPLAPALSQFIVEGSLTRPVER